MKILYVKNNSERAKRFQLKTIVYEEDGKRFVKKEVLFPEAKAHLHNIRENYRKLSDAITDPRIRLAEIVAEDDNSLTFEFIEGTSFETRYNRAKEKSAAEAEALVSEYKTLLETGFKTTHFDSRTMVNDTFKTLFGDHDYSQFDGELCFEGISNIDLILSNIIFKEDQIYLIDYEWAFACNVPLSFVAFRTFHEDNDLHWKMERHFIDHTVVDSDGFLAFENNYRHARIDIFKDIEEKKWTIENLNRVLRIKEKIIEDKEAHIQNQNRIIYEKDTHITALEQHIHEQTEYILSLQELVESMRLKNRLKKVVKKAVPAPLWNRLRTLRHGSETIPEEQALSTPVTDYSGYAYFEPRKTEEIEQTIADFASKPLLSIIMPVYNVDPKWLDLAIKSVEAQWYDNWELCIADDKSTNPETIAYLQALDTPKIKVRFMEENQNISGASNAALELVEGDYVVLMDNDDELTPDALYEAVKAINEHNAEFIYSDEDKIEMDGRYSDPNFKPDFAPDMFLSQNYLSHLGVIKKSLIDKAGGFTKGLEGSQDYDLYLKVLEHTDHIYHIDKVLYHWRKIPGSTAAVYGEKSYAQEAGRKALENAIERRGLTATVKNGQTPGTYKVDYLIEGSPLVSIIIPFKDKPELLRVCIESIIEKTTYKNFEIIGISNNSEEDETFEEMKRLAALDARISFYEYNVPFNYSQINNYAAQTYAKGEQLLFLNNDIEVITPSWIEEMLMYSQLPDRGAVGAKLYFPNDTIQHAGLIMAPKTLHAVILAYQGFSKDYYGYGSRLKCVNNYSAVTAACLMVKREIFETIGGFDAERLSVAYNDVDLCLRIQESGYTNVWTPYCELYHHESVSRGYEISRDAVERREREKYNLKQKHPKIFTEGDPFYNRNLTRFSLGFELDISVQKNREEVTGVPFYEEITYSQHLTERTKETLCIFSHFDAEHEIKEDVRYYLAELANFADIIFVSTAESLSEEELGKIRGLCRDIIVKRNVGYDFGAWKSGLNHLEESLDSYEHLILCNDSVYGPMYDLQTICDTMQEFDLWSMTDNYEIDYHLQSYFMVYGKKAFTHPVFQNFWENFTIYHNKQMIIEKNEIGFSREMMQTGLSYGAYFSCKEKYFVNVLHYYWRELIRDHKFPFVKKELLKRNPLGIEIGDWREVIAEHTDYDTDLIEPR